MALSKDNPIQSYVSIPTADSDLGCHRSDAIAYSLVSPLTIRQRITQRGQELIVLVGQIAP